MTDSGKCAVTLTTCGSPQEAEEIAKGLVAERLAACVQIVPITSHYRWQGKLTRDEEFLLLIKAPAGRYGAIEEYIQAHHSYELPEIVRMPIESGLPGYLKWLHESTRGEGGRDAAGSSERE